VLRFSQIFDLFLPFKGAIIIPYTVNSSCILISRHVHILCFINFYYKTLLAITEVYAFFFTVCTLPTNILTSSALTKSWCVLFNFKPSRFIWNLLKAYSKAKLKSNGDKESPCFKQFVIENMWDKFLTTQNLLWVSFRHILLVTPVSEGYHTQWGYFTGPPSQMNHLLSWSL